MYADKCNWGQCCQRSELKELQSYPRFTRFTTFMLHAYMSKKEVTNYGDSAVQDQT